MEDYEKKQLETITLIALIEVIFPPTHFLWTVKSTLFPLFSVLTIWFTQGIQRDVRQGLLRTPLLTHPSMGKRSGHIV